MTDTKKFTNKPREFPAWLRQRAEGHSPEYDIAVYARPSVWLALADAIEACNAPSLVGVERAEDVARAGQPTVTDMQAFSASEACCYLWPEDTDEHKALRAAYIKGAASVSTAGQEWRDILPRVIVHLEDGEGHDEGAFDESCDTCLLLRDLRALLPASPVAEPIVADKSEVKS